MIRRPPRSTQSRSSAASDVYKRQGRHVFSKKITSSEINGEIKIKAINGEEITIKKVNGIVYINEAEVVTADIEAPNGVIHFINRVLQPLN